jgi:DNA-binding IclR family transcriptional regulator
MVRTGSQLPIDAALTRTFLAFLRDRRVVERLLAMVPDRREQYEAEIRETQTEGAVVVNRVVEGLRTLSVPVFDSRNVVAALAIIGTQWAISDDLSDIQAKTVIAAGERLSRQLGYHGEYPVPDLTAER